MLNSPEGYDRAAHVQAIIDVIPSPIFVKNKAHRIVMLNSSACDFFGHSRESLLNYPDNTLFPADEVRVFHDADDRVFTGNGDDENEEQITDAAGRVRSVITRKRLVQLDDAEYLVGVVTDITAYRESQAHGHYLAFHDALTGLPNRALLTERIEQALLGSVQSYALLYIDLDRFKAVNDIHGHQAGDELIQKFGARLSSIVRASDTVARLSGDEFAILLTHAADKEVAEDLCRRVLAAASQAFELSGVQVSVSASIGVVFAGRESLDEVELQRRADVALYRAKGDGRGCSRVFTEALDQAVRYDLVFEADLRKALMAGGRGLELHYQPLVSLVTGQVEGFEALIRWQHPTRGLVMPNDFIPMAEASGLIIQLGEWVLTKACADAASWVPPLHLSVNVSPLQFAHGDLAAMVERVVGQSGIDPARLELEITEGVLVDDAVRGVALLNRIRALGVRIVLDDFGTGYSSLSYFRQFPFDKVKIDRSFVADMLTNSHARSIVEAVISLGRGLELQVVAEGVETMDQLALLQEQGCAQAQGYLISRPMEISFFVGSALRAVSESGAYTAP